MPHEDYAARRHPEFVVLDIGDELGALIVHADREMHGVEIEISPADEDDRRSHKEVLQRAAGERAAYTAVFDRLPGGHYTLWAHGQARAREVLIEAGQITELDWRSGALAAAS